MQAKIKLKLIRGEKCQNEEKTRHNAGKPKLRCLCVHQQREGCIFLVSLSHPVYVHSSGLRAAAAQVTIITVKKSKRKRRAANI